MMKFLRAVSGLVLIGTIVFIIVGRFVTPMPAWTIRVDGLLMLVMIGVYGYATTKVKKQQEEKDKKE
jgi:hypothetical protein